MSPKKSVSLFRRGKKTKASSFVSFSEVEGIPGVDRGVEQMGALNSCGFCILSSVLEASFSNAARLGHVALLAASFAATAYMGNHPSPYWKMVKTSGVTGIELGCSDNFIEECVAIQLLFRVSFVNLLMFSVIGILSAAVKTVNRNFWTLKALGLVSSFALCIFYGSNSFFSQYSVGARVFSGIWLLVQSLVLLDFFIDVQDRFSNFVHHPDRSNEGARFHFLYIAVCAFLFIFTIFGFYYFFRRACAFKVCMGIFTISSGIMSSFISISNSVSRGLLTPALIFAYSSVLLWDSFLSYDDLQCNICANTSSSDAKVTTTIIMSLVTFSVFIIVAFRGTTTLQIFDLQSDGLISVPSSDDDEPTLSSGKYFAMGDSDEKETRVSSKESRYEIAFFHFIMAMASAYCVMLITNWGLPDGAPEALTSYTTSAQLSFSFKLVNHILFVFSYFRYLYVQYMED